jgi:hypothetical protein
MMPNKALQPTPLRSAAELGVRQKKIDSITDSSKTDKHVKG